MENARKQAVAKPIDLRPVLAVSLFIIAIALAEELVSLLGAIVGGLVHATILIALFATYFLAGSFPYRRALLVLVLIPLMRLLSLTVPIPELPQVYWYAAIGIPLLYATLIVYRYVRVPLEWLRMQWVNPHRSYSPAQLLFGLLGIPLSLVGFFLLHPKPLISPQNWMELIAAALILIVFAGYTEELILRGLILPMMVEVYGTGGVWVSAFLSLVLYLGSYSIPYVLFNGCLGFLLALWVKRTGSILGAVMVHSLIVVGLLLLWPVLIS